MSRGCAICGAGSPAVLYDLPNGVIQRCRECGTVSRREPVAGDAAVDLYEDDAYLDTPYFEALEVGVPREGEPYGVYGRALDRIEAMVSGGRLLDVGCSYGAFLEMARERGFDATGVELSRKATDYARGRRGLEVVHGSLEQAAFAAASFDAVTLWDLIEHLDRPVETLRELHRVLAPGGVLVVFTINQRSLINRVGHLLHRLSLGRLEKVPVLLYDIHHNFFFDRRTLGLALRRAGFTAAPEIDWMEARIERWQNTEIPRLLAWGSRLLDAASQVVGRPYRMVAYVRKPSG
jgi:SAM-dependent methyltransferase